MRARGWNAVVMLVVGGAVAGCGKHDIAAEPGASAARASTASAAPIASASAAPIASGSVKTASSARAEPAKPLTAEEKEKLRRYLAALGQGRKATKEKRYDDAVSAFASALAARPDDARARAELGYAYLLDGDDQKAAVELLAALAGGVEPKLAAQVFYNLGLARELEKDENGSRAAFAAADALAPSSAAKAKLAGRSRCTAQVVIGGGEPLTDGISCIDVAHGMRDSNGGTDESSQCAGAAPWTFTGDYMQFTYAQMIVAPRVGGGAWVHQTRIGGWPAHCSNFATPTARLDDSFLEIDIDFDGSSAAIDETKPMPTDGISAPCMNVAGHQSVSFFDLATGKHLLYIYLPSGAPNPKVVESDGVVKLEGGGCGQSYDLKKLRTAPPP